MKLTLTLLLAAGLGSFALPASSPSVPAAGTVAVYSVDAGHSSVVFRTQHLGISTFWGRFNGISGELAYDAADPSASSIQIEIDANSVDTANEGRDKHLRSPDFFSVKEFPTIRFTSSAISGTPEALEVTGELELHGVKKTITVKGAFVGSGDTMFGDYRAGFDTAFTIDMTDFDMSFVKKNPTAVGPEVDLMLAIECVRQ
jgi:polyisoprenoid-binding protein YceI